MNIAEEVYTSARKVSQAFAELGQAVEVFVEAAKPLDIAVRLWPVYSDEYGGVMCGMEGCPCDCESSVIYTPWAEDEEFPKWTSLDLLAAIEEHIEWSKQKREEERDGD
jgi:hypothetical protein